MVMPFYHRLRRVCALTVITMMLTVSACTPKPQGADRAVNDFVAALEESPEAAAQYTDNPDQALPSFSATWKGLQATGLSATAHDIKVKEDSATVDYDLTWTLPRDRTVTYTTHASFIKSGGQWMARWSPAIIHPDLGSHQHLELRALEAERAPVVGSDGQILLSPGIQYRVIANKRIRTSLEMVAGELNRARVDDDTIPTLDPAKSYDAMKDVPGDYSLVILPHSAKPLMERIKAIPGIRINEEPALERPDPGFAPDILRRVSDVVSADLDGQNGWEVVGVTSNGAVVNTVKREDPKPAEAVTVSLNRAVQEAAQKAVDTRGDAEAMMVAIRPSTGQILAVAQTAKADKNGDVALSGMYPPGSTFKMITATAGMQKQGLNPQHIVPCPGTMEIGHRIVHNYNDFNLGNTSLLQAFARSCNTTFADISSRLKPGELKQTARQFGLGQDYTIAGLNTITGSVPEGKELVDRTEAGFGQGKDLASPFGMALVAATAAAGHTPTPILISSQPTKKKYDNVPQPDQAAIDNLRAMMREVVTSGTGVAVRDQGEVYGKTGEAEVAGGSHAWFAGYRGDLAFATLVVMGGGSEHAVAITKQFLADLPEGM